MRDVPALKIEKLRKTCPGGLVALDNVNPYPTVAIVVLLAAVSFGGAWLAIHRGPNLQYGEFSREESA